MKQKFYDWCRKNGYESILNAYICKDELSNEVSQKELTVLANKEWEMKPGFNELKKLTIGSAKQFQFQCTQCGKLAENRQLRYIYDMNMERNIKGGIVCCNTCAKHLMKKNSYTITLEEWMEDEGKNYGFSFDDPNLSIKSLSIASNEKVRFKCDIHGETFWIKVSNLCSYKSHDDEKRMKYLPKCCRNELKAGIKFSLQDWAFMFWNYTYIPFGKGSKYNGKVVRNTFLRTETLKGEKINNKNTPANFEDENKYCDFRTNETFYCPCSGRQFTLELWAITRGRKWCICREKENNNWCGAQCKRNNLTSIDYGTVDDFLNEYSIGGDKINVELKKLEDDIKRAKDKIERLKMGSYISNQVSQELLEMEQKQEELKWEQGAMNKVRIRVLLLHSLSHESKVYQDNILKFLARKVV